ncbi:MAG TPA: hypothetical protein VK974_00230 [Methylophilaceae bacterium]|nr:hypothetical protein [Methylophilaceae bacterium]
MSFFVFVISLLACTSSQACRFVPDERPLSIRIQEQPLVFIGTVVQSAYRGSSDTARFRIEHVIKGLPDGQQTFEVKIGKSSCDLGFETGQRWLFAGSSMPSPSQLLSSEGNASLVSVSDAKLGLPQGWKDCKTHRDCARISYGCQQVAAVNQLHLQQSQKKAWAIFGDPSTLECALTEPRPYILPGAYCEQNSCSILSILSIQPHR